MTAGDLWAEFNAARAEIAPPDRVLLERHGVAAPNIIFLIGLTHIRVAGGLYEPDENGGEAFLSPVLVDDPYTPESTCPAAAVHFGEVVDLVAWHPHHPARVALRRGAAAWLGSIAPQYFDPEPVPIHRGVLQWFRSGCHGLVLLAPEVGTRHLLVTGCRGGVVAENPEHAAELTRIMRQPWRAPPVTIARQEFRRAA